MFQSTSFLKKTLPKGNMCPIYAIIRYISRIAPFLFYFYDILSSFFWRTITTEPTLAELFFPLTLYRSMSSASKRKQPTGGIFGTYVESANKENLLDDFPAQPPPPKKPAREERAYPQKSVELPRQESRQESLPVRSRPSPAFSQEEEDDEAYVVPLGPRPRPARDKHHMKNS